MYTKCLYAKCIPDFDKLVYILYTKFSCHSSINFVYKMCIQKFVEMWCTFCIHIVQFLCQNVYTVSVWEVEVMRKIFEGLVKSSKS